MHKSSVCPDIRDYQGLASGQLPAETKESLLRHLEGCDSCVSKLQALPAEDTFVGWIQQIKTLSGGPEDKQLAPLIQRLIQLRQAGAVVAKPAAARTFAFSCPGCGKSLRVKEEAAGKKVRCPHCGQVAQTPAAVAQGGGVKATLTGQETGLFQPSESIVQTQVAASSKDQKLCSFLAPSEAADELGRLGPYRVLKVLGAGGMGVVFRAEDPQLQRLVALKAMLPDLAANESARQRFLREARAAAKLKHDHIVSIYQVGEDRGAPFLAMEFLEGEALEDRIKRAAPGEGASPLSLAEILRIGREIAEGLEAAHEHGLIHRDIKPGNVWLEGKRGRVKILDFGLARSANEDVHLTQSGAIVGTPAYMPPEQARGEAVDGRCDLYSLGCVLYRLCTGQLPFKGDNTMSLLLALATEQPKSVRELNADVPPVLADLIMRLLAKDPAQRPATAREVADALDAIDTGKPAVVKAARAPAPPRRRRRLAVAVAGGALVLAVMLTVIVIRLGKPEEGTVTIETVDPEVELVFTSGGKDFKVHDKKTGKEIKLPLGTYQVKLNDGKEGLKLNANQFTLMTRGDRALVKVTWKAGDLPKSPKVDIPAPIQVAQPPPLAEWLKGRTILTVAQDGSGQYKTIQAALNALKPGQVVKVLDRGPYRERLSLAPVPEDTGLVSEHQTVLELSEWSGLDKKIPVGHYFESAEDFRVQGFALIFPTSPKDGIAFYVPGCNGFVLENCFVQVPEKAELMAAVLIGLYADTDRKPAWVRDCMIRGKVVFASQKRSATVVAERNYLDGPADQALQTNGNFAKVVIRHNVFGTRVTGSTLAIGEMKEVDSLEVRNNTTTSIHPLAFAFSAPRKNVTVLNNLRSQPGLLVFGSGAEKEMPAIIEYWRVGHNAYPRQLRQGEIRWLSKQNIVPQAPTDVLGEPKFLSLDPAHPDFPRIAADSPAAKGGAGGAWPSYIGALPPGPAPTDGDWFTRLRAKWLRDKPAAAK